MLVSDGGLQPTPIFAASWILTITAHDVENFECVQRLYDFVLASHPLMQIYLVCAVILAYKGELEANAEEYQSSVCFFVFKSPLTKLSDPVELEKILMRARLLEDQIPINVLLTEAKEDHNVVLTDRP